MPISRQTRSSHRLLQIIVASRRIMDDTENQHTKHNKYSSSLSSDSSGLSLLSFSDDLYSEPESHQSQQKSEPYTPPHSSPNLLFHETASFHNGKVRLADVTNPIPTAPTPASATAQKTLPTNPHTSSFLVQPSSPDPETPLSLKQIILRPSNPQVYRLLHDRVAASHHGFNHRFGCDPAPRHLGEAYTFYQTAAGLGCADALAYLALAHIHGLGVPKSLSKAHELLRRAIFQGSMDAIEIRALCHMTGVFDGVRDYTAFLQLIEIGIAMNSPACLVWTGFSFELGLGMTPDSHTAKRAYIAAAGSNSMTHLVQCCYPGVLKAGDPWLLLKCALFLLHGIAQPCNRGHAMDCLKQAALLGMEDAQVYLGICLHEGKWLQRDTKLALLWLQKAAQGKDGHPIARKAVEQLE